MDLDTTVKGFTLTLDAAREAFIEICQIPVEDDVSFEVLDCTDIRETDDYPGIRVSLRAVYLTLSVPLKVDVTTGDRITPAEIEYELPRLFDDRKISVLAYNLETILSRSIANTRPRDFYDVYVLRALRKKKYRPKILKQALDETAKKRGSTVILQQYETILQAIESDAQMNNFWAKYREEFSYAKDIEFAQACAYALDRCLREKWPVTEDKLRSVLAQLEMDM